MKTFACKSLGLECDYVAEGVLEDEVMADALAHIEQAHEDKLEAMEETAEDLPDMVRMYIEDDEI